MEFKHFPLDKSFRLYLEKSVLESAGKNPSDAHGHGPADTPVNFYVTGPAR